MTRKENKLKKNDRGKKLRKNPMLRGSGEMEKAEAFVLGSREVSVKLCSFW